MPMRTRKTQFVPLALVGLTSLVFGVATAPADTTSNVQTNGTVLEMQRSDADVSGAALNLPPRGTTKDEVLAEYGQPVKKHPAVGDPPITRWDYGQFSMYFEYNLFLHAVVPSDPEPLVHKNQLTKGGGSYPAGQ